MSLFDIHEFLDKHEWVRYSRHKRKFLDKLSLARIDYLLRFYKKNDLKICKTCKEVKLR